MWQRFGFRAKKAPSESEHAAPVTADDVNGFTKRLQSLHAALIEVGHTHMHDMDTHDAADTDPRCVGPDQ